MPQMAPLNWLSLMITFTIILLLTNSVNYFSITYKPTNMPKFNKNKYSWKW